MNLTRQIALLAWIVLTLACAENAHAQAKPKEWDTLVAAAEKEGQLSIAGPPGDTYRFALIDWFQKKFPKIRVEYNGASGRDQVPRLARERQSGIFNWDVYVGGPTSPLGVLKPIGAFDPLPPELILPEATDNSKWHDGFRSGFMDVEEKLYYAFDGTSSDVIYVNADIVSPGEFKTFKEIANPKWGGKIVWEDPRQEGSGLNSALLFKLTYGEEFIRKLLAEQKIVFTRDRRQLTEWIVRGRYPIAVSLPSDQLKIFLEKGLGKNVKQVEDGHFIQSINPGFGSFGILNRRPHPNAAKLYANLLLTVEGQTSWAKQSGGRNSRRSDVPLGDPDFSIKPGVKYVQTQSEKMIPQRLAIAKLSKEVIPQ
ncbi:MAG TPA: extracellular solute-binding protein [Candidatus Binatia bacterium]|nr:extracellular solute-binding protein [Candidatus Binatia bacterium]